MLWRVKSSGTMRPLLVATALLVCLAPAFSQETAATLQVQVGQVSVLKDGNQVALSVGQGIRANQVVVTGEGAYARFRVADGTEFEVFEKSQVTFRDRGGSWKDLLNVWIGHVKVYVQHIFGPNPTSVTSPTAVISVRGTVFDVIVENDDGDTIVSVDEGKVQVQHRLLPTGKEPLLLPGDSIHIYHNQPLGMQINKGGGFQKVLAVARKALLDYIYTHPGGVSGPGAGPLPAPGGAQGDHGKPGTNGGQTNGGSSTGAGAPTPPTPPPPPPGGGGGD